MVSPYTFIHSLLLPDAPMQQQAAHRPAEGPIFISRLASLPAAFTQVMYQRFGGFIILVRNLISHIPFIVSQVSKGQGADILPGKAGTVLSRQIALEYLDVPADKRCLMMVVPNQASRLQAVVSSYARAVANRNPDSGPGPAQPSNQMAPHFSIISEQLGQLVVHEFIVAVPVALRFGVPFHVRCVPHGASSRYQSMCE